MCAQTQQRACLLCLLAARIGRGEKGFSFATRTGCGKQKNNVGGLFVSNRKFGFFYLSCKWSVFTVRHRGDVLDSSLSRMGSFGSARGPSVVGPAVSNPRRQVAGSRGGEK